MTTETADIKTDPFGRLKESEDLEEQEAKAGRQWAQESATMRQLRRLSSRWEQFEIDEERGFEVDQIGYVHEMINGDSDDIDPAEWWEGVLGSNWEDDASDPTFSRSFIEGALEFLSEYQAAT